MEEHKAVKIFTTVDNLQAEMILAALKDQNIPAYKKDLGNAGFLIVTAWPALPLRRFLRRKMRFFHKS